MEESIQKETYGKKHMEGEKVIMEGKGHVPIIRLEAVKVGEIGYGGGRLDDSDKVAALLQSKFGNPDREYAITVAVDSKPSPLSIEVVGIGSVNLCIVEPREIFKNLILSNASAFFLAHTHPTGDVTPSKEDIAITEHLEKASETMGIPMLDHIIFSADQYYSLREHGDLGGDL